MKPVLQALFTIARRFGRNARGGFVVPLALTLPVLFGFAMLAIDGGRLFNLQTSLQAAADALALAGAAELDGKSDSINRANSAINTLVSNDQRFGEGTRSVSRSQISVRFLTSIPTGTDGKPLDRQPITDAYVTTDATKAGFVEVTVLPVSFRSMFAAAANVVTDSMQTQAIAVAGFDSLACNVAPLFMCNPAEDSGQSLYTLAKQQSFKRRLIAMRDKGNQAGSGNYGFLVPAEGNSGASNVSNALAVDKPPGCYSKSGVEVRPGYIASTAKALNVRFDMYEKAGDMGDFSLRPAANVRKGFKGATCSKQEPTEEYTFPRDPCHLTETCTDFPVASGSVGDGNWDFEGYWTRTYGAKPKPVDPDTGLTWSNAEASRPSRYQVYRYEIKENLMSTATSGGTSPAKGEVGTPLCYTGDKEALKTDPIDRRVFVGAILDCKAYASEMNGSSGGKIPVTSYGKFFLTEPMDKNDSRGTIWVEMIELVEPGTVAARNIIRDTVQLVR
jgi:Flp pilus assembly protein TadG